MLGYVCADHKKLYQHAEGLPDFGPFFVHTPLLMNIIVEQSTLILQTSELGFQLVLYLLDAYETSRPNVSLLLRDSPVERLRKGSQTYRQY